MPIFSFISHCFFPDGSKNHPSVQMGFEVKGSQLMPVDSVLPSCGDELVPVGSKVPSSWGQSVPVISEVPSSHGQSILVDSEVLNSQCLSSKIFKYSELEEATNNFDPSRIIDDGGIGGYETVYFGKLKDGRPVAIKRLRFKGLRLHDKKHESRRLRNFMNEVAVLTSLSHENLVQLYGSTSPQTCELILVQEYIPYVTVADHLDIKRKMGVLPWSTRLNIAIQTASALAYLHASNIIHRDVGTRNILLDSSFNAKVAEFGLCHRYPLGVTHITAEPAGTLGYIDPDYYERCLLSDKGDVYSFGVVLIELISSLPAFSEDDKRPLLSDFAMDKILCGQLQKLVDPALEFQSDDRISHSICAVAELAFRCLQRHRNMRPSMGKVLDTLESIRGGSSESALTWGPNSYNNDA